MNNIFYCFLLLDAILTFMIPKQIRLEKILNWTMFIPGSGIYYFFKYNF